MLEVIRSGLPRVQALLGQFPAVAILGPRQCGKSTLARMLLATLPRATYLDLERASDRRKLTEPELYFQQHDELVVLDEVQRAPELFTALRSILDERKRPGQVLILGSASRDLIAQSSETLAGRIAFVELTPFLLSEVLERGEPEAVTSMLWRRGGFPLSFLAANDTASFEWRLQFIRTFLERDLPQLGVATPAATLERFWQMCAHVHGQTLNASKIGEAMGMSHTSIRSYVDLLTQTFVLRTLPPFATNLKKRLVKSPKLYVRDTGLLHALLGIEEPDDLLGHPVFGASWEGFVIENVLAHLGERWRASFYRTASGVELDLVLERGTKRIAVECKASAAPVPTHGFWIALEDLGIERALVIGPREGRYPLKAGVEVMGLAEALETLGAL